MASKSEYGKRFGTLFLASIFLFTSVGVTVFAIWQTNSNSSNDAELQSQLDAASQQQPQTEPTFCDIQTPETAPAETAPETYKPEGDVTELQTTDLVVGTGREAKAGDCLVVKYLGTLAADGTKFDGNFDEETALQFMVGTGMVIPGWDQGLVGMKEGGIRRIVIPSDLGYGENGAGSSIPPNADLVFVVKLVKIKDPS